MSDTLDIAETGLADTPPVAIHDLEALEAWSGAFRELRRPGRKRGPGGQDAGGVPGPWRLLIVPPWQSPYPMLTSHRLDFLLCLTVKRNL